MSKDIIKIGSAGLGRLGYLHASNIAQRIPGAKLEALCDADSARLKEVADEFNVPKTYNDFEEMCANPDLDAIVIVTPSMFHAEQSEIALKAGKHVFCEKPLDVSIEKCKQLEKVVEAHPDQVYTVGFMRRYDHSYQKAKEKIDNGDIGRIVLVRSYCQDSIAFIKDAIAFGPHSGGQFLDMCIHDIDTIRWFTGGAEAKNLWGIGGCFEFEEYRDWNDGDNVSALVQFEDESMGFMFAGRAAAHGCNIETEIIGTRGTLRIGAVGTDSMLEVLSENGVCRECHPDWRSRWHDAYIEEIADFVRCIRTGDKPRASVYDGTKSLEIAYRCKESFETGKMLAMHD